MSRSVPNTDGMLTYKLLVVGSGGVGKSAITIQYFQRTFPEDHDPTIEDSYLQNAEIDNQWCLLDVLDTAGQDEFSAMREQYMRKGDGFILVYDVSDRDTFLRVRNFHSDILRVKDAEFFPVLLVANKIDLVHQRKVSEEEGRALAKELRIEYIETTAKPPPINVDETFHRIVRMIRAWPKKKETKKSKIPNNRKCHLL